MELSQCNNINTRPYMLTLTLTYETTPTNYLVANVCEALRLHIPGITLLKK